MIDHESHLFNLIEWLGKSDNIHDEYTRAVGRDPEDGQSLLKELTTETKFRGV